jgi:AcrR family transcriptional regulator
MQDIYRVTNLSPGVVYNYFSSKEEIVIASISEMSKRQSYLITSIISDNAEDSLVKLVRFWLTLLKEEDFSKGFSVHLDYYAAAARSNSVREAVVKFQDVIHEKLIELVRQNQKAGIFNAELDPLAIVRTLMGIYFGMGIHKLLVPEIDLDTYGQVFEAMVKGTFSKCPKSKKKTV